MGLITINSPAKELIGYRTAEDVYSKIIADFETVQDVFHDRHKEAIENFKFYKGDQWSDYDIEMHRTQARYPFVFNEILHKFDHLIGIQTQTRLDIKAVAREYGDINPGQIYTYLLKWAEQMNNLEYTETAIFKDMLIGGLGVSLNRWDMRDVVYGLPIIEQTSFNELFWDLNSKQLDCSDMGWMGRIMRIPRIHVLEMFPEHAKEILEAKPISFSQSADNIYIKLMPLQEQFDNMRGLSVGRAARDLMRVIEYYERFTKYQYLVVDDISNNYRAFDTNSEAQEYYAGLIDTYSESTDIQLINPDGTARVQYLVQTKDTIVQTIVVGDKVLEVNELAMDDFPYTLSFGYFYEGDYWGFVDALKPLQIFVNRNLSQWDYSVGTMQKGLTTIMTSLLPRGITLERVRQDLTRTNPILPVITHDAVKAHDHKPIPPEIFQNINLGISRMQDYAGGKNALGFQENAAESGVAVQRRAELGGISKLPFFDMLRMWRRKVGLKTLWHIQNFMPQAQLKRLIGEDPDLREIELDKGFMQTLREIKLDVTVEESIKSDSYRERTLQTFAQMLPNMNIDDNVKLTIMLEYMDIPESKKELILQMIDESKVRVQTAAQLKEQEKLEKQVSDQLRKRQIKDIETRTEEVEEAREALEDEVKEFHEALAEKQRAQAEVIPQ